MSKDTRLWGGSYADDCALSSPTGCRGCGKPPVRPRLFYCSDECATSFLANHSWDIARYAAMSEGFSLRRGYMRRDALKPCAQADETCEGAIEVDHMVPLNGARPYTGCVHHQDGLQPLCHSHHVRETNAQRRDGRIGTPDTAAALRASDERERLRDERRQATVAANPRLL